MADPKISITASQQLLDELHEANAALRKSRHAKKDTRAPNALQDLIVRLGTARLRVPELSAPAGSVGGSDA